MTPVDLGAEPSAASREQPESKRRHLTAFAQVRYRALQVGGGVRSRIEVTHVVAGL
jgi:hypothetical protein